MSAQVSIRELFRVLLPRDYPNGWLAMLSAYFDDSGTHEQSDIVLIAGLFGTEWELSSLDLMWKQHIDRPLCGRKASLRRFHMAECQDSRGEFSGWSRTETDYFCHQLQTAIIESGVSAYGVACSRKDWDELVTGDMRAILGNPEGQCVRHCFVRTIDWAQRHTFDPKMTFIFDNRPSPLKRDAKVVFDAFEKWAEVPALTAIAFASSYDVRPLQAADMIAWEFYQHANDILVEGIQTRPRRKQFRRFGSEMNFFTCQIATRSAIVQIVDHWEKQDSDDLKAMANHFMFFDPENPDYSHLSGKRSS